MMFGFRFVRGLTVCYSEITYIPKLAGTVAVNNWLGDHTCIAYLHVTLPNCIRGKRMGYPGCKTEI